MQPAEEHSPWPKRIMIAGVVAGLIGVVAFTVVGGDLVDYMDPREVSDYQVEYDSGTNTVLTLEPGCWVVNVEGDQDDYTVKFQYVENGAATDMVSDDCRTDFQAASTDADFSLISKLNIEETSDVLVTIECEDSDGCDKPLLFTNSEDALLEMFGDAGLWLIIATCCSGAIMLPLGWILVSINNSRDSKVMLTQQQIVDAMNPYEQEMNPNQEILTTDQLYKLVRGEMPDSEPEQTNVPSPFSDVDTRVKAPTKAKTGGSINRASSYTHENPPTDESWKNWDES